MNNPVVLFILFLMNGFLVFCQVCIMIYGFKKFLDKPRNDLETRVQEVEIKIKEIEYSLKQGNDKFREQEVTNQVVLHSILALIEFEIQYCLTEHKNVSPELQKAKDDLHNYLSNR